MKNFKNYFVILSVIFVITALSGCALNKRPLVASGHPEWAPIMSQSGDKIVGVGPELVEKIFNQLGIEVSSNFTGAWDVVQTKVKTGEVDVLVAAYKTDERQTYMNYSDAYVKDPIAVFINKENKFSYAKWEDLINKKGVATVGDSYGQEFDDYIKNNLAVARVETTKQAFDMLAENQADYFLYALYSGNSEIKKQNYGDKIEALPEYASTENFYITISKKSPYAEYLPQVNKLIAEYKADGTIDKLMKKYSEKKIEPAAGIANPASVNCAEKGGALEIRKNKKGEYGVCFFEDNQQCEEWALLRGDCPVGGVKITGYENNAEIYCAITGGQVEGVDTPVPMCKIIDGTLCNAQSNFDGECPDPNDPNPNAGNVEVQ